MALRNAIRRVLLGLALVGVGACWPTKTVMRFVAVCGTDTTYVLGTSLRGNSDPEESTIVLRRVNSQEILAVARFPFPCRVWVDDARPVWVDDARP